MSTTPPPAFDPMTGLPQMVTPPVGPWGPCSPEPRRRSRWTVLLGILFLASVSINILLLLSVALLGGGADMEDSWQEKTLERGPSSDKIAVIRITGVIDDEMAQAVHGQLQKAAQDASVKAVIIRINSPGGGLTASDMIHHDIKTILGQDKTVIASMDSVAASGGFYVACATGHIVAQETTITGSIGVIAEFFFINGLLKDKLGINTLTLKCGDQKDVPNLFAAGITEDQQKYLQTSLLDPGFARFKDVVAEGRKMKPADVDSVATGRIFMARDALAKGLIDEVGYFDRAILVAKSMAKLKEARVVEYQRQFRLTDLLGVQSQANERSVFNMTPERLAELGSPRVMYLWTGY
jgi:protease IV